MIAELRAVRFLLAGPASTLAAEAVQACRTVAAWLLAEGIRRA